jgi:hypothetical protein
MTSRRRATLAGFSAAAVAVAGLLTAAPAGAATQSTIDGKTPSSQGCTADQRVIYHTLIMNGSTAEGYVDIIGSTYCHAAWGHVHGVHVVSNQTWVPAGHVHRNSDGKNSPTCTAGEGKQDCYTTMLWDLNVTSYAYGQIDPNGATGALYSARTPNY